MVAAVAGKTYVGTGPDWAVVIRGHELVLRRWLDTLDGRSDLAATLNRAERLGLQRGQAAALLERLLATGMAVAAPRRSRSVAKVAVVGQATVANRLVKLAGATSDEPPRHQALSLTSLRLSRVGKDRVEQVDSRPNAEATALAAVTLVVLVLDRAAADAEEAVLADDIAALGIPTLVVAATTVSRVGPLVLPGVTSCLRCEDLELADRDQDWREIALRWALEPPDEPTRVMVELTCGEAARRLQAILDRGLNKVGNGGGYSSGSTAADVDLLALSQTRSGGGAWEHRHPIRHPACGCCWQEGPASAARWAS